MNKLFIKTIIFFCLCLHLACDKDFLDLDPLGEYSETNVWKDLNLAETFVNKMYINVFGTPFAAWRLSDYSDESHFVPDWGTGNFNKGLITSDDLYTWPATYATAHLNWNALYANIRQTNIFFSKIEEIAADDPDFSNRLKGEVYFMRAATYHYLTTLYGGVPIITDVYGLNDDFFLPRNNYAECIDFIVSQLDSAAALLPESYSADKAGRITKGGALGFKAKVLVYAASDLHNPEKNGAILHGYAHPELLGYTNGSSADRWRSVKNAAKAVIDMQTYSLYAAEPTEGDSIPQTIADYFLMKELTAEDMITIHYTPKTSTGGWVDPVIASNPNGYHGTGNQNPIGDLVDDYEMKDGSKFDWKNPVHKANPYLNRDARFYATVLYEGVQWATRPSDALVMDPYSRIQTGYVYNTKGTLIKAGLDTRKGPIEDWNGSYSGYYLRKAVDPTISPTDGKKQDIPFRYMRYAEILLIYAEACNELGEDAEARDYVNMVRKRAGQPNLPETTSGNALRKAIRQERRIEFAFEDHRFWDVRRWLIGPEASHQTHGVDIRYTVDKTQVASYRQADGSTWGTPVFNRIQIPGDLRIWHDKLYFFPIMRDEILKNDLLIQNPGY